MQRNEFGMKVFQLGRLIDISEKEFSGWMAFLRESAPNLSDIEAAGAIDA